MKIEFRKVPQSPSEFNLKLDSVSFSGTFCKISTNIVKLDGIITGNIEVDCSRCAKDMDITFNEKVTLLVSDGIYKKAQEEDEEIVIEVDDHIIDFDEILQSEIESIRSEFYICDECKENDYLEIEY